VKVICNSSPLINLAVIGRLELLRLLYGTIVIPEAVYQEVAVVGHGRPGAVEVGQADRIVRETVSNQTAVSALHELDRGEAEAVVLALENSGSLLIMDERRGRLAAVNLGIDVIGILGILLVAKRKGLIAALAPEIERLQTQVGFRIRPDLKEAVLRAAGEGGE